MAIEERIDVEVRALETCAYKRETFRAILDQVQKYVDQLNLQSYTNLQMWVQNLDKRVSKRLFFEAGFRLNSRLLSKRLNL